MTIRRNDTHDSTHHSESIEIVPELRLAAVMGDSTYKYLLRFIAIGFAALLKENRECMDFNVYLGIALGRGS